jgi:hypothetical protein
MLLNAADSLIARYAPSDLWDKALGNRTRLSYYAGPEPGNPSGETSNIQYIHYESKDKFGKYLLNKRVELTYDSNDNLLTSEAIN